jgi:predicted esterase
VDDFDFLTPGCVWDSPDSLAAVDYVHGLIRKEINRGVKAERIFVAGHSQGGILATLAVPKFSDAALGGILMCSSVCPHDVSSFVDAAQKDLKVHAMHSPQDAMIPYASANATYEPLKGGALGTFTFREQDDNLEAKMFHEPLVAGDKPGVLAFLGLGEC